jgi:hypothetical protein
MSAIVKFGPGLAAGLVALVAVKLIAWLGWASWSGEVAIFVIVYLAGAVSAERAMQRYGAQGRSDD